MNTVTAPASSKLNTLGDIQREMKLLRSFVVSVIGEDKEGKYNQKFVNEIFNAVREKPARSFGNPKSFLYELRGLSG